MAASAAVLTVVAVGRVTAPRARLFVCPPLDESGSRLQLRLPAGWDSAQYVGVPSQPASSQPRSVFVFEDRGAGSWPSNPLGLLSMGSSSRPTLVVEVSRTADAQPSPEQIDGPPIVASKTGPAVQAQQEIDQHGKVLRQVFSTSRLYYSPDGGYRITLQYLREGRPESVATLDSFAASMRITTGRDKLPATQDAP